MSFAGTARPVLARKARLRWDAREGKHLLVYPERGLLLSRTGGEIVRLCDGTKSLEEIAGELARIYRRPRSEMLAEVIEFAERLRSRGLLEEGKARALASTSEETSAASGSAPRPFTLVAELTHRCPLACPYCSNPTTLVKRDDELTTEQWCAVLDDAATLGVVQLHLTGGEPLARTDLEAIAAKAREVGLYTNLITSGIPLTRERLAGLAERGVDAVQVSVQDADAASADDIAGYAGTAKKLEVARWVKELGLPLTVNVVLHRKNLDHVEAIIALAEELRADRLELANTQYQGWAFTNRGSLLPTPAQLDHAYTVAVAAQKRLEGTMDVLYVKPDYFGTTPRGCMDGWARRFIVVSPDGKVLPCQAATVIDTLSFETVRDRSLAAIWESSPALLAFRGEGWMKEPCASCDRRTVDFGGCRCQAFQLTGDAAATDPACSLSPRHALVSGAAQDRTVRFLMRGR